MAETPDRFVIGDRVARLGRSLEYIVVSVEGRSICVAWRDGARTREDVFRHSQLVLIEPSRLRVGATRR